MINISNKDFFDPDIIKVFDGIAGGGKTSEARNRLNAAGVKFLHCTSTNKLKKDIYERFGGDCATIAGGLFHTVDGVFFDSQKEVAFTTVVIDEILQTDRRALAWADNNRGAVNIIICTDTEQTLTQNGGNAMLEEFREFCKLPYVCYCHTDYSYRPVNDETRKLYNFCYEHAGDDYPLYYKLKKKFRNITFQEMPFNADDIYICHTNDIEEYLFAEHHIENRYDLELIPKGSIASKGTRAPEKYPILPQKKASRYQSGYLQPANIGTVTRYQGSEVNPGHTLYYLVEPFSRVTNREFYTMVTRAKDARDICIVTCEVPRDEDLLTFNGKPIKARGLMTLPDDFEMLDGMSIKEYARDFKKYIYVSSEELEHINKSLKDTSDIHYTGAIYDYKPIFREPDAEKKKKKVSMHTLINKEPALQAEHMNAFLRSFERAQRMRHKYATVDVDNIRTPLNLDVQTTDWNPKHYQYGIDLYASYPHCFKFGKLPDGRKFYPATGEEQDDPLHTTIQTDGVDFYLAWTPIFSALGVVVTGDLVRYMQANTLHFLAYYLGSSPAIENSKTADYLMKQAYTSVESKKELKEIHYGYMQKKYLEPIEEDGDTKAYFINETQRTELLMCAIQSTQALTIAKIKKTIYGSITEGRQYVDCLYFNTVEDIQTIGDRVREAIPEFDFRIFKNDGDCRTNDKPILYKTYQELKTRAEIKRDRDRERMRRKRAERD